MNQVNEVQYKELCEACDRLLLAPDTSIERVAIPWLHVIREHPIFLVNYVDLFQYENRFAAIGRHMFRLLRNKAAWFRQVLRASRSDGQPWFGPKDLPKQIDVIIISHLLSASHAGQKEDFYFGNLPDELVKHGHTVLIALINHSGQSGETLACCWGRNSVPRVVLSGSLGISKEITFHHRQKRESARLKKMAKEETSGLVCKILARTSQEALSGGARTTLRLTTQIGTLVAKLKPKAIVVTHEGHAWERNAFAAARRVIPTVRCIGYQHAALFRLQHAIRRNLASEYNPDHILTAGLISKEQLERAPGLNGIPISVLGSNRTFKSTAGNDECRVSPGNKDQWVRNAACLVIPEGIITECLMLFRFSLACAQAYPEIQFIWRLHPLVTFESLVAQKNILRNLPKNIELAKATLDEDISRCGWALYRGTTAIVQAVVADLRPIYLQLPGEMTIDPLYELENWRVKVRTVPEFLNILIKDINSGICISTTEAQNAKKYCDEFFTPFDTKVLLEAIRN